MANKLSAQVLEPSHPTTFRPRARRRYLQNAAVTGLLAVAMTLTACGSDKSDQVSSSSTGGDSSTSTASSADTSEDPGTTTQPSGDAQVVNVYFVRDEKLAATTRTIRDEGVAAAAIRAAIAGPNADETAIGFSNEVPAGTEVLGVNIASGSATVDLSDDFASGGGSLSMQLRVAQVVATVTQFPTVETVTIRIDGKEVEGIGGEGVPSTDLDRSDFEDVTPAILIESPAPGATVPASFTVAGTANTFEATYQWAVLDSDGETLDSGFDTATSGTGTRGTFETDIDLGGHTGAVTLKLYESSAKDGSEINVVEIPLTVG